MNENYAANGRKVDDAGIRLAPAPMDGAAEKKMPSVRQELVITPRLEYDGMTAAGVSADVIPFKFVPERFDVITGWIDAFRATIDLGWKGDAVGDIWIAMVPDMILTLGLVFILVNVIKAVTGLFGAIRPRRYTACSVIYLLAVIALFIAALAGAETVGLAQIDFMNDFIHGWKTSEFFTLFVTAGANLILAVICSFITPLRTGYTRVR